MDLSIFIRSHYLDHKTEELFRLWSTILPGRVGFLLDETAQVFDTGEIPKISFDLAALAAQGLPSLPPGKTAWYCGDYVMAAALPHMTEHDIFLVVENDAVPVLADVEAWRALLADFATCDLVLAKSNRALDDMPGRAPEPGPAKWKWANGLDQVYTAGEIAGGLIICLGFTRATAALMTRRRHEILADGAARGHGQWPHCEAFVGTEARRAGLKIGSFWEALPKVKDTLSTQKPYWWGLKGQDLSQNTLYHPVMDNREKFLGKLVSMVVSRRPRDEIAPRLASLLPLTPLETRRLGKALRQVFGAETVEAFLQTSEPSPAPKPAAQRTQLSPEERARRAARRAARAARAEAKPTGARP